MPGNGMSQLFLKTALWCYGTEMTFEIRPVGAPVSGRLVHREGDDGYVYDDWSLNEAARAKMLSKWPALDLAWVDLAAKEFASAWAKKGSNKDGFVGWREDIKGVLFAASKLLKALKGCAFPAQYTLGRHNFGGTEVALYDHALTTVAALIDATNQLKCSAQGIDARNLPHPMPELIIKLARQLRYTGHPWDRNFKLALVSLTTMTLDGLGLRHELDIRTAVRDALNSGDKRLEKLR